MNILVLGHSRHGKDTVAEILSHFTGLTFNSSSLVALNAIYPVISEVRGIKDKIELFHDRHNCRKLWKECINLLNYTDKSSLTREILANSDIYVGMRSNDEFEASRHLFKHIVWVDARNRMMSSDPTMLIEYDPYSMHLIDNNRDLRALRNQVKKFAESVGLL